VVFDVDGNLWVSENANEVDFIPPFSAHMNPVLALGRSKNDPHFGSPCNILRSLDPLDARSLCPTGLAFDSEGDPWVADSANNRVLKFVPPFSTGMAASLELGQPAETAFTSSSPYHSQCAGHYAPESRDLQEASNPCPGGRETPTANSMYAPARLAFDTEGDLWVGDQNNGRVLEFTPPFSNGMAATTEIGEEDFAHRSVARRSGRVVSANTITDPADVAIDSLGNLVVVDHLENRVLFYAPPFRSGMAASVVLGSPDFTGSNVKYIPHRNVTAMLLDQPINVLIF
jgi:DNA-binding beta-propeller fold protein YncE